MSTPICKKSGNRYAVAGLYGVCRAGGFTLTGLHVGEFGPSFELRRLLIFDLV